MLREIESGREVTDIPAPGHAWEAEGMWISWICPYSLLYPALERPRAVTTAVKTSRCHSNPLLKFCGKGAQVGMQHCGVFRVIEGGWGRAGLFGRCVKPKGGEQSSTSLPSLPQHWAGLPASSWHCPNSLVSRAQALRGTQAPKSPSAPGLPVTISLCRSPGTKSSPMGWHHSFSTL